MDANNLMVTIPLSVYTDMVKKLAVYDVTEKKDGEILELTDRMQKEIDDLQEQLTGSRNMWYSEHKKVEALEKEREELKEKLNA